jgi:DNA-binding NtrC family response regulator
MAALILIVDDDPIQRRLLEAMARRFGYDAETLDSGEGALARLQAPDRPPVSLVILDLVMPDLDGMAVLARMRQRDIATPAIVQTAHGSIEAVISAMRAGATDFVVKPVGAERLQVSIKNALRVDALEDELRRATRRAAGELGFRDIVSRAEAMARTVRLAERAAKSNIPVLVEGESGVGKELMARAIQGASERRGKAFVTVNCGALPETLVESILFGHEKGSFTGATEKHIGKFAEANGGTLFLDEIGELTLEAQVKLLRALQDGEIDPVGSRRSVRVDFRLVSATNQNLIELVKRGRFREICSTASTSFRSRSRRSGRAPATCLIWPCAFSRASAPRRASGSGPFRLKLWRCSASTTGRAMSASWRTRCSARSYSPMETN